jgi:hypothetical protein
MFDGVAIPTMVRDELNRLQTPGSVRALIAAAPSWLSIVAEPLSNTDMSLDDLDDGVLDNLLAAWRKDRGD